MLRCLDVSGGLHVMSYGVLVWSHRFYVRGNDKKPFPITIIAPPFSIVIVRSNMKKSSLGNAHRTMVRCFNYEPVIIGKVSCRTLQKSLQLGPYICQEREGVWKSLKSRTHIKSPQTNTDGCWTCHLAHRYNTTNPWDQRQY